MTSWAKNQIAKQLARFVKNLEPSQISLKFLKGEGELSNLELNEQVLSELLELPPWLQLKKAVCNRICAKIHWTSLKTDPIRLFLDCVEVEIHASDQIVTLQQHATPSQAKYASKEKHQAPKASKYGFAEKVVDGMFVSINSVLVSFKASGFKASFSMSRFIVQSTDQHWTVPNNLRKSRIKDEQRGQVLIFKEIKWSTMRLDADAAYAETTEQGSIPIRLITNNSAIRLTIKKRLNDCSLVSSRLEIVLDDILWILTQSQLLKLSSFVHYILRIRQKFLPMATHNESPKDHRPASSIENTQGQQMNSSPFQGQGYGSTLNKLFTENDVSETSYHLRTNQIDLHLCDDQTLSGITPSTKARNAPSNEEVDQSGALLISIYKFQLDHYPYHIAGLKRKLERTDDDALFSRRQWAQQLFDFFLKNEGKQINQIANMLSKTSGAHRRPMMYESFFLISCSKFAIMQVSTSNRQEPKPFLSSDKESLFLPDDMNSFLLDFTSYYYIGYRNIPVPPSNMFLKMNPLKLTFSPLTCIWLNKFIQSVVAGFEWTKEFMTKETGPPEHLDIRIECLMPQVTIPCESDPSLPHQEERPKALQVQISQAVISNSRIGTATSQSDLLMDVQNALASRVYTASNSFPNVHCDYAHLPNDYWVNDYSIIHSRFFNIHQRERTSPLGQNENGACDAEGQGEKKNAKEATVPRVIWCIWCEQIWIDFTGVEKSFGRPVTLIDAVPVRLWLSFPVLVQKSIANVDVESGYLVNATLNGSISSKEEAVNEPSARHWIKTSSTSSLPASFNSNAMISSPSNASSCSSVSIESSASNQDKLIGLDQTVHYHRDANRNSRMDKLTPSDFHATPLRTSYSDTDLMPNAEFGPISNSLEDFSTQPTEGLDLDTGPPPPYSISQVSGAKMGQSLNVGSSESLPPTYSQLPPYQATLKEEDEIEAPPLPRKIPKEVTDYFSSNEGGKIEGKIGDEVTRKLPTIGSILQVAKETCIQLDHFQLVFLMRLQEMFADVALKISEDTMKFQTLQSPLHKGDSESSCFSLHLSLPSVDVNIILPPLEDVEKEQLLSLDERMASGKLTRFYQLLQSKDDRHDNGEEMRNTSGDSDSGAVSQSETSCSSSEKSSTNSPSKTALVNYEQQGSSCQSREMSEETIAEKGKMQAYEGKLKKSDGNEFTFENSASMGKNSADAKDRDVTRERPVVETRFDVPAVPADHVMIADYSDDDDNDELYAEEDAAEYCNGSNVIDVYESEAKLRSALRVVNTSEIGVQTESETVVDAGYETYRDEEVSVVCLKCKNVRVALQSENQNSLVKIVVDVVRLKEKGNITYGMTLDHRLSADKGKEKEDLIVTDSKPQIMVRLVSGPAAKEHGEDAVELGFAHVKVSNLTAELRLSSAESLSEFVEDEYLAKKMPFKVELDNLNVKLMDNKARRYLSAILPPPMELHLGELLVTGLANGNIKLSNKCIMGVKNGTEACDLYENQLVYEAANGKEKNVEMRFENERLLDDLKLSNARLVSLEQERDAILKVVEKLQQELMWSNHENDKLIEKVRNYRLYIKDLTRK